MVPDAGDILHAGFFTALSAPEVDELDVLTKRIIPCLDVDAGRVVKGISFVELRDAGDPAELAAVYDREGGDELVFLDITASSDSRDTMVDVVRRVSEEVFIPLTVGGGIRTVEDIRRMLKAGADKVSLNTAGRQQTRPSSARAPSSSATSASWWPSTPSEWTLGRRTLEAPRRRTSDWDWTTAPGGRSTPAGEGRQPE